MQDAIVPTNNTLLFDAIARVQQSTSAVALGEVLRDVLHHFGYDHYLFTTTRRAPHPNLTKRVVTSAWPDAWMDQYVRENLIARDPVAQAVLQARRSFKWKDTHPATHESIRIMDVAATDYGMADGIAIPIFGSLGREAGVTAGGAKPDQSDASIRTIELLVFYVFNHLSNSGIPIDTECVLTPRQREMMHWVAAGKTDFEIGVILSVATDTVNKTVNGAMRRLDSHTRTQAVAEAIRRKEIFV